MKDYRTSMDHLSFSPDQKQAMTARLAAATRQKAAPPKARRTRRILAVAVAAALVLSLGTAGATGAHSSPTCWGAPPPSRPPPTG